MIIMSNLVQVAPGRGPATAAAMARRLQVSQSLALTLMYLSIFTLSALVKWLGGVPSWFVDQFQGTWISSLPGGLTAVFYGLAVLETLAALGFALSLLTGEFLRVWRPALWLSLLGSLFIFIILAYGSRLSGHMDTAGWNFVYFIGTIAVLHLTRLQVEGHLR